MDSYIVKVLYQDDTPYRFNFSTRAGGDDLSYQELESAVKVKLDLPPSAQLKISFKDDLGEFVRMKSDEDLRDALITQALNPLVVKVKLAESPPKPADPPDTKTSSRWGWGSSVFGKARVETSASETVSDARWANGEMSSRRQEHHGSSVSKTGSYNSDEPQSALDTERNNQAEEDLEEALPPITHPKPVAYKCYGCGTTPIVGPWYLSDPVRKQLFSSCVYHLCENCFVRGPWRHSTSLQFKLIKECAECHQYRPDVRRYPYQGNAARQSSISSTEGEVDSQASEDILFCDWCFKGIARRAMSLENSSLANFSKRGESTGQRLEESVSNTAVGMTELLPAK